MPEYTSKIPTAVATTMGPRITPRIPNTSIPPSTLINTSNPFSEARPPSSVGRRILSTIPPTAPQSIIKITARPHCPVENSQMVAGIQTGHAPTTASSDKNAITTPQKIGDPNPTIANAPPQIRPCTRAITTLVVT